MAKIIIKDGELSSSAGINVPGSFSVSGNVTIGNNFTDTLTINSISTFNDELIIKDTLSGTIAQFTTITASNIYPLNIGSNYPLLLSGPEIGLPGWQIIGGGTAGVGCAASSSYLIPFWFTSPITVNSACFYVTATTASALMDFSIWRCEATSSSPGFIPVTRVQVQSSVDVSTVGLKQVSGSMPLNLDPGFYVMVLTANSSVTCRGLTYNADSFRGARLSATDFQLQLVEAYLSTTGFPISTNWSGSISVSVSNGATGYRGQAAIRWS
jgi:hypothetical protein